ncbi:hypothetical protein [Actinoplanes awajinensis]|uniref:Uncharacterized protein n=1 Tax=Actinoplanes awajinensis subsp. mycoplanecinus TaxID=135947 RepID=A0A124G7C5_9ACTN|nr:hypothetical protein [Actinoplanes awajinensis]KUL22436.1 hypothetical protein ADL15_48810 [Actinoplanes awajinensis subsp. mycoplanecinus]
MWLAVYTVSAAIDGVWWQTITGTITLACLALAFRESLFGTGSRATQPGPSQPDSEEARGTI